MSSKLDLKNMCLTPNQARQIIELLATDDEFRAQITDKPAYTLARIGVTIPADATIPTVSLPPKADLAAALDKIHHGDIGGALPKIPGTKADFWALMAFFAFLER